MQAAFQFAIHRLQLQFIPHGHNACVRFVQIVAQTPLSAYATGKDDCVTVKARGEKAGDISARVIDLTAVIVHRTRTPLGEIGLIKTKRCEMTGVQASDEDHMVRLMGNADVYRYLGGPVDEAIMRKNFAKLRERGFNPNEWVIRERRSGASIGWIGLSDHHDGEDTEISYLLLPEWWRQGYGKETVQAILDYAVIELALPRVIAETQSANVASCRLLESLGMRVERTLERFGAPQSIYSTVPIHE